MTWSTAAVIEEAKISEKIEKSEPTYSQPPVTTHYVNLVFIQHIEDWEKFALLEVDDEVFKRLEEAGKDIPDEFVEEDDHL